MHLKNIRSIFKIGEGVSCETEGRGVNEALRACANQIQKPQPPPPPPAPWLEAEVSA